MKIFDLFNSSKKQITLEEKYDDIVNNVLLKDNSNINDVENIRSLTKLIVTWFKIQFETELNKYNVKEDKISDFLDRNVFQLLDIYDVSSLTNLMHQKINKKLFQKYEDNPKFKEKIFSCDFGCSYTKSLLNIVFHNVPNPFYFVIIFLIQLIS